MGWWRCQFQPVFCQRDEVEVCLFDERGGHEVARIELPEFTTVRDFWRGAATAE